MTSTDPKVLRWARFLSTFLRGFIVTFAFAAITAVGIAEGDGPSKVLGVWFRYGVVLGLVYAYIIYREATVYWMKRGIPSWASERVALSPVPWAVLDALVTFGLLIPLGGYAGGIAYTARGLWVGILVIIAVSVLDGLFRGAVYSRLSLPYEPWFLYIRLVETIIGGTPA